VVEGGTGWGWRSKAIEMNLSTPLLERRVSPMQSKEGEVGDCQPRRQWGCCIDGLMKNIKRGSVHREFYPAPRRGLTNFVEYPLQCPGNLEAENRAPQRCGCLMMDSCTNCCHELEKKSLLVVTKRYTTLRNSTTNVLMWKGGSCLLQVYIKRVNLVPYSADRKKLGQT
jgi:hypothetical protein